MNKFLKKFVAAAVALPLIFSFGCKKSQTEGEIKNYPPAFSVIKNGMKLKKQAEKDQSPAFSAVEFDKFFGAEYENIFAERLPDEARGVLSLNGKKVSAGQKIPRSEIEKLRFTPQKDIKSAVFTFKSDASDMENTEFVCEIVFREGKNTPPVVSDADIDTYGGINVKIALPIKDAEGDGFDVNVYTYPKNGKISIKNGEATYTPNADFSGVDTLVFGATDEFGAASEKAKITFNVAANDKKLVFDDMADNENHIYAFVACAGNGMTWIKDGEKTYFEPTAEATRIEFLVTAMSMLGLDEDTVATADTAFSDDNYIGTGAKGYLARALAEGYISYGDGKFRPTDVITAGEAAEMVLNMLGIECESENTFYRAVAEGMFAPDSALDGKVTRETEAKCLFVARATNK